MNLDDQLVLGIVFIIAGVAMGLLAYAALLNRRSGGDEEELPADEPDGSADVEAFEPEPVRAEDSTAQPMSEPGAPTVSSSPGPPLEAAETRLAEPDALETRQAEPAEPPPPSAAETVRTSAAEVESKTDLRADEPSARLRRDETTGRLRVDIGENSYGSIEELRASEDWEQVSDLFSDVLAWMVKQEPKTEETYLPEEEPTPERPLNMIQQINDIIKERLAEREGGPKAVRLMEGADGSVRVYIGVDSYEMDEVPDEEAQAVIRQAVREWEARQ